jgi:hypothetical protein
MPVHGILKEKKTLPIHATKKKKPGPIIEEKNPAQSH